MIHLVAILVFLALIVTIIIVGLAASRWKSGNLNHIEEWGLGGRRFGTLLSWFLIGGDAYTAYTFIAVPGLMFGAGAVGFFALPYTVVAYPILYLIFPKLWRVASRHGYITGPEFVRGRYGNRWLALAVGITGIAATMPYIALQLVGMQVVIGALGIPGHLPLVAAFIILAAFTWTAGLRAPAMISVIKDLLIYLTIIVAIIAIPIALGGFGSIFAKISAAKLLLPHPHAHNLGAYSAYATLAVGSAFSLFLYPHTTTGVLSSAGPRVIKRNAVFLPAYSILLSLIALLGYMAIASGVDKLPQFAAGFAKYKSSFAVPALFLHMFPAWFVGVGFAAITIGALVPAAIMAIAAANIFTRDIYEPFIRAREGNGEIRSAKIFALFVILCAMLFILFIPMQFAIQLQLLGGMWIIQTFPVIAFSVFTRFFNGWALLVGWGVGIITATCLVVSNHFGAVWAFHLFGYTVPSYIALATLILNIVVAFVLSLPLNIIANDRHKDETNAADYLA